VPVGYPFDPHFGDGKQASEGRGLALPVGTDGCANLTHNVMPFMCMNWGGFPRFLVLRLTGLPAPWLTVAVPESVRTTPHTCPTRRLLSYMSQHNK
jgi:hypothetical protein